MRGRATAAKLSQYGEGALRSAPTLFPPEEGAKSTSTADLQAHTQPSGHSGQIMLGTVGVQRWKNFSGQGLGKRSLQLNRYVVFQLQFQQVAAPCCARPATPTTPRE